MRATFLRLPRHVELLFQLRSRSSELEWPKQEAADRDVWARMFARGLIVKKTIWAPTGDAPAEPFEGLGMTDAAYHLCSMYLTLRAKILSDQEHAELLQRLAEEEKTR